MILLVILQSQKIRSNSHLYFGAYPYLLNVITMNMKKFKLILTRSLTLTLLAVLMSTNILAQSWPQSGDGTEGNPYLITSTTDWNAFAYAVNGGYSYSGEFVKLTANIEVACTTAANMVGTAEYSFKGTFDGGNNTLEFYYDQLDLEYVAPFRYINGATIKNLNVEGEIKMKSQKHNAGGLFCINKVDDDSRSTITNCIVSLDIINRPNNSGGFANDARNTTFTKCIYNGKLVIGRYSGGFSANGNNNTHIDNCLCAPKAESDIWSGSAVFVRNNHAIVSADSYWTLEPSHNPNPSITTQGSRAYTTEPAVFTKYQALIDGNNYYVEGDATITDLNYAYTYTGNPITVSYGLTFAGVALTEGTDFMAVISPATVQEKQTYTLTLTGAGAYHGTLTQTFDVIEGLTGDGTVKSPYLIYSDTDWEIFTENINAGVGAEKYYKLVNNITVGSAVAPISTIVGVDGHPFSGHFDGDFHTLKIYINRTENYAAPFGVIYGATIENLAVEGTVTSTKKYLAGIAAMANYNGSEARTNNITNCISRVDIYCNTTENSGDCSTGGLIGQNETGIMNFTNCIFDGTINGNSGGSTQKCGGFVNWNGGTINYNHCAMAGQIINVSSNKATFNRGTNGTFVNDTVSYFCIDYGGVTVSAKVRQATTDVEGLGICGKYTLDATTYYVPGGVITGGVETTTYAYTGDPISTDPFVITYYGWTLTEGTDYDIVLTYSTTEEGSYAPVSVIQDAGFYKINITGKGNYGGTYTCPTIHVIDISTWSGLKTALAERNANITLTQDYSDDNNEGALVVSGTIVLDLNGHIINRNKTTYDTDGCVIKVEADANLTINDSNPTATHTGDFASLTGGIITGGYNYGNGGGIYNDRGTLTLNNVTVYNNKCEYTGGGIYCAEKSNNKSSRLYMNGGAIRNNEAIGLSGTAAGGGGIYANTTAAFQMNNVTVTGNRTISKGGGIRIRMSNNNTTLNRCTITNNVIGTDSESKGGGIYCDSNNNDPRTLTITDCEISANTVTKEGGGIYVQRGTVELNNCTLAENVAGTSGGGVCVYSNELIVNGGVISGNTSTNQGGGVYMYSGKTMHIKGDAQIVGNTSTNYEAENVYLAGGSDVIGVIGDITGANIGISRVGIGDITSGLDSHGTEKNFTADNSAQWVIPYGDEAYLQNYYIWNVTEGWPNLEGITKDDDDNYTVDAVVAIRKNSVATANSITTGAGLLIIEDGGQLVTGSTSLAKVQMEKTVNGSTADDNGWYLVSSTVANPSITSATNLITTGEQKYDLYRYNEASDLQWENYRAGHEDFATLENGRGYLYRNENDHTINVSGTLNVSDVSYSLSYNATTAPSGNNNTLKGFNIIGNPYSHTIYKGAASSAIPNGGLLEEKYYTLSQNGEWVLTNDGTAIAPMTGILVQATEAGVLTMKNSTEGLVTPSRKSDGKNIWFTIAGGNYEDRACVEFKEGRGLNKIAHQNEDAPMLYINHKGEDFASVDMGKNVKLINLNFDAKTTGYYTLSMKSEGEFDYIHLIDCLTGKDIDMMQENEYTFIGSATDKAERFLVRLNPSTSSGTFAYQSGDDIIVEGEGELQVFDVMGRMVATQQINGVQSVNGLNNGVYIFRLEGKTQKIVVR